MTAIVTKKTTVLSRFKKKVSREMSKFSDKYVNTPSRARSVALRWSGGCSRYELTSMRRKAK